MKECQLIDDMLGQLGGAPDKIVLSWRDGEMSAAALTAAIKMRAASFRQAGITKGDCIAIWMPKGPCAVQCLLAAFRCGAIAVPLDPSLQAARVKTILNDVEPMLILTDSPRHVKLQSVFGPSSIPWQCSIEDPHGQQQAPLDTTELGAPFVTVDWDDPCLILMTSGSTGTPKGVVTSYGNIQSFSDWAIVAFTLTSQDQFANIAPLHFDLSLLDIITALKAGGSVRLIGESETLFPMDLAAVIEASGASILYTVPTTLQRLLTNGRLADRHLPNLRLILFAGEVFPPRHLRELMMTLPHLTYANLYGPSETNVIAYKQFDAAPKPDDVPNIGRVCSHSRITLRDAAGEQVPKGTTGEICVKGPTVMHGYWGRPDLTQDRYLENHPGVFKTGDFGYFDFNGDLRFIGRRDRQIKITGYRIELGEVESVALQSGLLEAAAVTVFEETQILLHVVPMPKSTLDSAVLKSWLAAHLPRHAIPSSVIEHRLLPVTATGKIDYIRLKTSAYPAPQEN